MHFMLDLSVEQVKLMCKCYIQNFMDNRKAIPQSVRDESIEDLVPQKYETNDSKMEILISENAEIHPSQPRVRKNREERLKQKSKNAIDYATP